jgi:hypothetical protein
MVDVDEARWTLFLFSLLLLVRTEVVVVVVETVVAVAGGGLGIRAGRAVAACRDGDLRRLSPAGATPPVPAASFTVSNFDAGTFSLSFNDSYKVCQK